MNQTKISMISRYPNNWQEIARQIKEKAGWKCSHCQMQCLKPNDDVSSLTKSERMRRTLTVHHANYQPEDNRQKNLVCLCSGCHLARHTRRRGNVCIGQLSLNLSPKR